MAEREKVRAMDGSLIDKEVYELLYEELNTYTELPLMLELATNEVAESGDVGGKDVQRSAVSHHISGLVSVVRGVQKALEPLEAEVERLGIDLSGEMDSMDVIRYRKLKEFLESFL